MRAATVLLLVSGLALTGCVTPTPQERRAADEAQCRSYGFRTGTNAFAECLQRIDLERRADRRARLYGAGGYGGYGGGGIGLGIGVGRYGW